MSRKGEFLPKEFKKQYAFAEYWKLELEQLPSCCGIGVFHNFPNLDESDYYGDSRIKRAINQSIMLAEWLAKSSRYEFTTLVASTSLATEAFDLGLQARKWKVNNRFTNRNSDYNVRLYYKFLPQPQEWPLEEISKEEYVRRFCRDVD